MSKLDEVLREGIRQRKIPAVVAAVATAEKTIYTGAFGVRDSASSTPVTASSIFGIASMTKAITTAAALQLVEQGKLTLDEPVSKWIPAFAKLQVLDGFDAHGKAILRTAVKPITLRLLLSHTSGLAYDLWDEKLLRYYKEAPRNSSIGPLMTEPGTRWEYGTSIDWTGRLVETISKETLEAYFQKNILQPLGMKDTSFIMTDEKFPRRVNTWRRQGRSALQDDARKMPNRPTAFNGGGGLDSTAGDYVRFMQMILNDGKLGNVKILKPETVAMMRANQTGELGAGKMKTTAPDRSSDVDFHPGVEDRFTLGFLMNPVAYEGGRSAGSLAWAGIANTFYWIDPQKSMCAVVMMQFLPFCDAEAMGLLRDFERTVYSSIS